MERINRNNGKVLAKGYDEWCQMVKMCFESGGGNGSNMVSVGSIELMRLHPVFNKISYYGVKDFLSVSNLVKLRPNQLLYR